MSVYEPPVARDINAPETLIRRIQAVIVKQRIWTVFGGHEESQSSLELFAYVEFQSFVLPLEFVATYEFHA
jgi:hypothetical protein